MSRNKRVAVVTGSNKGIGLAIVRGLAQKFQGDVFLTARNAQRGMAAIKQLHEEQLQHVQFHQLDIDDAKSIERLRDFMKETYDGIDILVNNAAIAFKGNATEPFGHQAEITVHTNYFSLKNTCDILFPILRPGARVVNMSSYMGWLPIMFSDEKSALRAEFASSGSSLTVSRLDELMKSFVADAKEGNHKAKGWPNSAYGMSKVGVSALTRIQQQEFDEDLDSDLVVNHVHPGYVDTDMTSHKGHLTVDQGARSAIYAALLPPLTDVKGKFIWEDCSLKDWLEH